jgi:hypothetical protein
MNPFLRIVLVLPLVQLPLSTVGRAGVITFTLHGNETIRWDLGDPSPPINQGWVYANFDPYAPDLYPYEMLEGSDHQLVRLFVDPRDPLLRVDIPGNPDTNQPPEFFTFYRDAAAFAGGSNGLKAKASVQVVQPVYRLTSPGPALRPQPIHLAAESYAEISELLLLDFRDADVSTADFASLYAVGSWYLGGTLAARSPSDGHYANSFVERVWCTADLEDPVRLWGGWELTECDAFLGDAQSRPFERPFGHTTRR